MAYKTIPQLFDLSGKGAVVTGGAKGIGQASAMRLAEAGAAVIITDIDMEAASQTVKQIKDKGGKARAVKADASSSADANRVVAATIEAFGHIDILVNNAGIFPLLPALNTSEEVWDKVLDVNLKGAFLYSQAAAREMIKAGRGGKIINIASTASLHPNPGASHYASSKGGLMMLTKSLALEWAGQGILVNAIAPGGIPTPGIQEQLKILAAAGIKEEAVKALRMARQPLGRMGDPDDIAKTVLFLASAAADYITGSMILVDGGYLLS
jgi:2-deoxy-D-gluconate 3-dehydrogenase